MEIVAPFVSDYVKHTINLSYVNNNKVHKIHGLVILTTEEKDLLNFVFDLSETTTMYKHDVETLFQYNNSRCLYQYSEKNKSCYVYIIRYKNKESCKYSLIKNNLNAFTRSDGEMLHDFLGKHFDLNDVNEYVKRGRKVRKIVRRVSWGTPSIFEKDAELL